MLQKLTTFKDPILDRQINDNVQAVNRPEYPELPVYADNVEALAGGMLPGMTYRTTTGVFMVVF